MDRKKRGYGDTKQWCWGMRSDIPSTINLIGSGTIYITPWTMDTPMKVKNWVDLTNGGIRFKFSYEVVAAPFITTTIDHHFGIYKMFKGTGGTAGTLGLLWSTSAGWTVSGSTAGAVIKYDYSSSPSIAAGSTNVITDGALYVAQLVVAASDGPATVSLAMYGNTVSSGTWLYDTANTPISGSLPQTINTLSAFAKTFQEHWITQV